ncbi:RNA polymerase sigma factor [Oceanobacillus jeddahense]|uniref:Sigma-70 family RNA polymerase sigma factor n=1 Tax=Oceanobacillus jeddahense TaxID=1462527 RepID=A0ABY5JQQ3_9BACI|nr:sigma-70 family RNA polymerase sigma factor [Oceanobacillus jeddahense]UUI02119.1 sigma-70 family RNA polymerase sigma factor [Oceanobacillus jeddahense]
MREFKKLYELYSKDLFSYLFFLTNNHALAEELVQETFYQAFKSIHRFRGESKVKTWLFQIAKHLYYNHRRENPFPANLHFDDERDSGANTETPETILQKKEDEENLYDAIAKLREPYKQVVVLRTFSELSFKEIGEIFSNTYNWARVTFYRAKIQLQSIMSEVRK